MFRRQAWKLNSSLTATNNATMCWRAWIEEDSEISGNMNTVRFIHKQKRLVPLFCMGMLFEFYVSYVLHRLCLYIWYDILISWSWCLYILSYVNIMDKGASHSQISSNIPKLSPILTIQKNMDGETATGSQTKAPFPSPNITTWTTSQPSDQTWFLSGRWLTQPSKSAIWKMLLEKGIWIMQQPKSQQMCHGF